jgi:hypothetical protein
MSAKTIATIHFKGGVGKTTVIWCLADTLSTCSNATVLKRIAGGRGQSTAPVNSCQGPDLTAASAFSMLARQPAIS